MSEVTVLMTDDAGLDTLLSDAEIQRVAEAVLDAEGVRAPVEVSVSFVDSDEMRGLNAAWRGIDAPTDVLSFECDGAEAEDLPEGAVLELGDVILAPEVIASQAPVFGFTPAEECRLMLVHGLLHLLGYDHLQEAEAAEMEAHELAVLSTLAAERGEDPERVTLGPTTRHEFD